MTVGDLFTGIGGFSLGLERAGMTVKWQVEIDPFCNKVLAKHWPNVKRYGDIRDVGAHNLESVDLICGGFPCQPFSVAGKRKGKDDDRYLWPEMLRVISQIRPTWVIGENVAGIVNVALDTVLSDMEGQGYSCQPLVIPACAVDARHRRDRLWVLAHSKRQSGYVRTHEELPEQWVKSSCSDISTSRQNVADSGFQGQAHLQRGQTHGIMDRSGMPDGGCWWNVEPAVGRVANGIPNRVDRLKSLGNAVVPQIVEILGRAILEASC